jgi:hypothetical protein
MNAKWEDQLTLCLDTAFAKSEPWDSDVRDAVFKHRTKSFQDHEDDFERSKAEVLLGSELVGKVARVCADHEGRSNVSINDMIAGIAAAVHVCKARLEGNGKTKAKEHMFFLWCE